MLGDVCDFLDSFLDSDVRGVLLRVWLERAIAFIVEGRVETKSNCGDCLSLRRIVRRILLSVRYLTPPWATTSILSKLETVERT